MWSGTAGALVEFRSVVDAVRCAIEVQSGMVERKAGLPAERRIEFRIRIHPGDVVEESDGDLMGDGVNIAARLEGIAKPNAICLSEDTYRQVRAKLDLAMILAQSNSRTSVRAYLLEVRGPVPAKPAAGVPQVSAPSAAPRLSIIVLPFANLGGDPEQEYFVDGVTEIRAVGWRHQDAAARSGNPAGRAGWRHSAPAYFPNPPAERRNRTSVGKAVDAPSGAH
jgi:adenylate cyclase